MKKDNLLALRELLLTQLNYWAFFPLVVTCYVLIRNGVPDAAYPSFRWWAALSVVPFLLYFVRIRCKILLLFLILHCAPVLLAYWIPVEFVAYRVLFVAVMLGFTAYSFYLRFATDERLDQGMNPIAAVCLAGGCVFLQHYLKFTQWDSLCINVLIVTLGLYFVSSWLSSYLNFLLVNKGSASHIPERAMFASGLRLSALYTLLGMAVLAATANFEWLRAVLGTVWEIIRSALAWVFSHFHYEAEYEEGLQETQEAAETGELLLGEAEDPFWLWTVLEYLAYLALAVGLVWVLYIGIRRLIRFIRANWGVQRRMLLADTDTAAGIDVHEKIETLRSAATGEERRGLFDRLSPRERIRRLYRKQAAGLENAAFVTARECGAALELPEMAQVYEAARYSLRECTAADVKRMKEACRRN